MIHLFTLLFLAFIATSCEMNGGELDKKNNGLTFAEGTELLAEFKARGGSATFKFTADLDWEATASEEWITVSPGKGEAGEGQIKIKAKENEELEEREGYVDITLSNDKSYRIEVEQMEGDPICELGDDGEYIVSAKGGEVEIEVTTNIEYSIFIPTSARKWISHEDTRALRTDTVILDISKNTGEKRSATIKLRDKRGETLQEITIEQKGVVSNEEEKPVFEIGDNGEYIVEAEGGDVEIEVTTNLEYSVYIPKDVEEWIEYVETRSVRNETVVLNVAVNDSETERTAIIELRDKSGDTLEEITIVQRGEEPVFEIGDNGEYIVEATGGDVEIDVTTNLEYDVYIPKDVEEWVELIETRSVRNETVVLSVAVNDSEAERTAVIELRDKSGDTLEEITIVQRGKSAEDEEPVFEVGDNGEYIVEAEGGDVEIEVTTNLEYSVYIPKDVEEWVELIETRSVRNETVVLRVAVNDSEAERTAVIELRDKSGDTLEEITIVQRGKSAEEEPVFEIGDNGEYIVEAEGGDVEIEVTTNLEYSVYIPKDVEEWVELIETRSVRNETVVFSVAVNDSEKERTAIIELRDKSGDTLEEITIVQRGKSEEPVFEIGDNGEYIVEATGGDVEIEVTTNLEYSVYIPKDVEEWVELIETRSVRNETVVLSVAVNESEAERTAVIELRDASGDTLEEITIVQRGKSVEDEEPGSEVPNNEIWYTTTDGMEFNPHDVTGFGANLIDNTYVDGKGVLLFDGDVTTIGERAFYDCSSLTSITIPDSVTTIGDCAFYWCSSLTSITIPNSVTTIGVGAFCDCSSLTEFKGKFASEDGRCLIIDGTLNSFAPAGVTEYTIPDSVTTIGEGAFENCYSLTSINIPDSVTEIGMYAFENCDSLTSVTIPDSVTAIGDGVFEYCRSLTSITIPDSVKTIGSRAFYECSNLTSITIPDSVTEIGGSAFYGCSSLTEFKGKFASEDARCLIIDGTLNSFAPAEVTEYTIPDSVTEIGDWVFYGCSNLISVTLPDSVTTIGDYAFVECSSLTSVTIGNSVTEIGYKAFYKCSSLDSVYCKPTTPPSIEDYGVFDGNASSRKIYVPAESVEAYKTASYWSKYADSIVGYNFESGEVPNNEIWYTTTDGMEFNPHDMTGFGANLIDNTYVDGKGVLHFDGDVTTIGAWAFEYCSSLTSITIPNSVTTIGERAFYDCSRLTSVTIGNSVTTIGEEAFYKCSSLTSITIPNSVTTIGERTFYKCSSLQSVTIGNSVTAIGYEAFAYCSSLISITIPDSVTTIGNEAFWGCSSLTSITIPNSVTEIGDYTFYECSSLTSITIPDSITEIGDYVFRYCSSLTSITIPNSVTTIGWGAFSGCSSLESVTIPDSVTAIGWGAFKDCSSLTSITIPDSVTEIGDYAFSECSSLTEFKGKFASEDGRCLIIDGTLNSFAPAGVTEYSIPNSVTTIGYGAFVGCSSLTSVTIPDSVTTIGDYAFYGCSSLTEFKGKFASEDGRCLIIDGTLNSFAPVGVTEYTIPNSVTAIGDYAFQYCSSLTSVTIGNSVTAIGEEAFYKCSSLTSITIPDSVTEIEDHAFRWCSSLTSVTIGNSVTTIRYGAFEYCSSLKSVYCKPTTPPSIEYYVFNGNASGRKIYVPAESVEAYKTASYHWRDHADSIVSYDF